MWCKRSLFLDLRTRLCRFELSVTIVCCTNLRANCSKPAASQLRPASTPQQTLAMSSETRVRHGETRSDHKKEHKERDQSQKLLAQNGSRSGKSVFKQSNGLYLAPSSRRAVTCSRHQDHQICCIPRTRAHFHAMGDMFQGNQSSRSIAFSNSRLNATRLKEKGRSVQLQCSCTRVDIPRCASCRKPFTHTFHCHPFHYQLPPISLLFRCMHLPIVSCWVLLSSLHGSGPRSKETKDSDSRPLRSMMQNASS